MRSRYTAYVLGDQAYLRATWHPRPLLQVQGGVAHQSRSGSVVLGTGSFKSNSVTLTANAQF